jgi:hypothetical protein
MGLTPASRENSLELTQLFSTNKISLFQLTDNMEQHLQH